MLKLTMKRKPGCIPIASITGGKFSGRIIYIYFDDKLNKKKDINGNAYVLNSLIKRNKINLKKDEYDMVYNTIKNGFKRYEDSDSDTDSDQELPIIRPTKVEERKEKLNPKLKDIIAQYQDELNKEMKINNGDVFPMPTSDKDQTDAWYIAAPRGAGKSTFAARYMTEYSKKYPKNKIIIVSQKENDKVFKKLKPPPYKLDIDDDIAQEKIDLSIYEDTLLVFDDYECFPTNKKKGGLSQQDYVNMLRDKALKEGRSKRISVLVLQHTMFDNKSTRTQLTECDSYVIFTDNTAYHIHRALKDYLGYSTDEVNRLLSIPSRWLFLKKKSPRYCVHEHGAICF